VEVAKQEVDKTFDADKEDVIGCRSMMSVAISQERYTTYDRTPDHLSAAFGKRR
jgi:hypothetical protein